TRHPVRDLGRRALHTRIRRAALRHHHGTPRWVTAARSAQHPRCRAIRRPGATERSHGMTDNSQATTLSIAGHTVTITHPDKPYFSKQVKLSKLDIVQYYLSVADGALLGIRGRP